MTWMRRQLARDEGFTLIELMVVVLIIAILIAIAIPTFLGARERAQDRASQSDLRNALTAAKVFYVDEEAYLDTDVATTITALEGIEPSLDFDTVANTDTDAVGFLGTADTVIFVNESESGTFFCIADQSTGTTYGSGAALANVDTVAECQDAGW